jgi:hypothetical protein
VKKTNNKIQIIGYIFSGFALAVSISVIILGLPFKNVNEIDKGKSISETQDTVYVDSFKTNDPDINKIFEEFKKYGNRDFLGDTITDSVIMTTNNMKTLSSIWEWISIVDTFYIPLVYATKINDTILPIVFADSYYFDSIIVHPTFKDLHKIQSEINSLIITVQDSEDQNRTLKRESIIKNTEELSIIALNERISTIEKKLELFEVKSKFNNIDYWFTILLVLTLSILVIVICLLLSKNS